MFDSFRRQFLHPYFLLIYLLTGIALLSGYDFVTLVTRDPSAPPARFHNLNLSGTVCSMALASALVGGLILNYIARAFAFPWKGLAVGLMLALNVLLFMMALANIPGAGLLAPAGEGAGWFPVMTSAVSLALHYLIVVIANACGLPGWHPRAGWWNEDPEV